jgi:hypothetical protein
MSQLYEDNHPDQSLKGTGYKNKIKAINTINLVKKRSLKYQFDVINTMYYRAKHHANQTKDMMEAMLVFKQWLKHYKKNKLQEEKWAFLNFNTIIKYEQIIKGYKLNEIHKYSKFYETMKKTEGKYYKLQYIPITKNKLDEEDFWSYRINFIKKKLLKESFNCNNLSNYFHLKGKYYGLPTKKHMILIMHGYSPFANIL